MPASQFNSHARSLANAQSTYDTPNLANASYELPSTNRSDLSSTSFIAGGSDVSALIDAMRRKTPVDQAEVILGRLEERISSEDKVVYLRHLGNLLSTPEHQGMFKAVPPNHRQNRMDQIVERLMSHLQAAFAQQPFDPRLCKYLIFTLMTVMEGSLAQCLTVDVVTVVMHELIMLTILYSHDRSEQMLLLVRAINATVVSYTDNAHPTVTLCFMIRLLHSPPMDEADLANPDLYSRYQNITTRMMVKLVKKLPELMPVLELELILIEIDRFLYLYSASQDEVLDLPNRIIKTIVHSIVKYKGAETRDILRRISHVTGDDDSTLVHLVNILLHQQSQNNAMGNQGGGGAVSLRDRTTSLASTSSAGNSSQHAPASDSMERLRDLRARVKAQSQATQNSPMSPPAQVPANPAANGDALKQIRDRLNNSNYAAAAPPPGGDASGRSTPSSSSIAQLRQRLDKLSGQRV